MKRAHSIDVFSPLFVVSGLLGTYATLGTVYWFDGPYSKTTVIIALSYLSVFAGCFALGIISNLGVVAARRLPRVRCRFSRQRLVNLTVICVPIGIAIFWNLVERLGFHDPLAILANLLIFREGAGKAGTEYLLFLAMFMIEAPFWAWLIKGNLPRWGRAVLALYWFLILGVSILTGARVRVYTAVMGLVFVYHVRRKQITFRRALIVGLLAVVPFAIFYQLQGNVRGESASKETVVDVARGLQVSRALVGLSMRFADAYDGFLTIIESRDRVQFLWGKSFYDAIFLPIPRAWVPGKPSAFNYEMLHQLAPERELAFFGAEYSLLGELYMNFQLAGIAIGGFLFGLIIGMFQRYYLENRDNPGFAFMYRPLFLSLPMAWMTSGIINSEAHSILILNLVCGAAFMALARVHSGRMWAFRRTNRTVSRPDHGSAAKPQSSYDADARA